MIKAVIFDFGGVVHSLGNFSILKQLADFYKVPSELIEQLYNDYRSKVQTGQNEVEAFRKDLSIVVNVDVLTEDLIRIWKDSFIPEVHLYDEIIKLVEQLKAGGYKTAVLSNTHVGHATALRELGWYGHFDSVFLSHEVGIMKPDKKIYEHALKELGVSAQECIYIDDLAENLTVPNEIGMTTILAKEPRQVVDDVNRILYEK